MTYYIPNHYQNNQCEYFGELAMQHRPFYLLDNLDCTSNQHRNLNLQSTHSSALELWRSYFYLSGNLFHISNLDHDWCHLDKHSPGL